MEILEVEIPDFAPERMRIEEIPPYLLDQDHTPRVFIDEEGRSAIDGPRAHLRPTLRKWQEVLGEAGRLGLAAALKKIPDAPDAWKSIDGGGIRGKG